MLKLTPTDYRVMPWKNGGGETTELYAAPDADGSGFLWRVSIATVAAAGPFSLFEGYDRHIMTIEGNGIVLNGSPAGPIAVSPIFHPCHFSGDWPITSALIDGPVRDLNLIAKRDCFENRLECLEISGSNSFGGSGATLLLHLLEGEITTVDASGSLRLSAGESLLLQPTDRTTVANKANGPSRLALAHLVDRR
jgi:environmental stress-induced protein Ves